VRTVVIVTVSRNSAITIDAWAAALERAWAARGTNQGRLRAVVVDNASSDDTLARLARHDWVNTIRSSENLGFARACNVGIARALRGDLVVLLNPDVEVDKDFFEVLRACEIGPDVAAIGPRVVGADGRVEHNARRFPTVSTGIFGRTSLAARLFPRSGRVARELVAGVGQAGGADVDWVSGACMIVPAERFSEIGPLDPGYFMYWEDADWCQRAHNAGLRVRFEPALRVRHAQGTSARSEPLLSIWAFHRSALRYYRIHADPPSWKLALAGFALAVRGAFRLARYATTRE